MAQPQITQANYPKPDEVLAIMLAALRYSYARDGLNVNVLPGSDHWRRAKVNADRVGIAVANNRISVDAINPLTAQGQHLIDLAGVFGVYPRPASHAVGAVYCFGLNGSTVAIPEGFTLTLPNGTKYATTGSSVVTLQGQPPATYSTPYVWVEAVKSGAQTNAAGGTVGQWDSAQFGQLAAKCIVTAAGLISGVDEDTVEVLRERLLRHLRARPVGGNPAHVREVAEGATAAVESAFVYSAVRGPGSCDVAVVSLAPNRLVAPLHVSTVQTAIAAAFPGIVSLRVTKASAQPVHVHLAAKLGLPMVAGGSSSGWADPVPWPSIADAGRPKIVAVGAGTITVNSVVAPAVGVRFGVWNPSTLTFGKFTVQAVTGVSELWVLTIGDVPAWVEAGQFVSAWAVNIERYAAALVSQFLELGPGEKTNDPRIVPRGNRYPAPDTEAITSFSEIQLAAILRDNQELQSLSLRSIIDAVSGLNISEPSLPATSADAPRILTLAGFSLVRKP